MSEDDGIDGHFQVDTHENSIEVVEVAECDILIRASVAQLNALRDDVAALRRENRKAELFEKEWPIATEPEEWYLYADHAINQIFEAYTSGNILKCGKVMWY